MDAAEPMFLCPDPEIPAKQTWLTAWGCKRRRNLPREPMVLRDGNQLLFIPTRPRHCQYCTAWRAHLAEMALETKKNGKPLQDDLDHAGRD